jgi:hypothetical protein
MVSIFSRPKTDHLRRRAFALLINGDAGALLFIHQETARFPAKGECGGFQDDAFVVINDCVVTTPPRYATLSV